MTEQLPPDLMTCPRCDGQGTIAPAWPVGPGGGHLSDYKCLSCDGTGKLPTSRPVMNPPADEAEARNRANTAPRQADPAAPGRGKTGVSSGSEAGPVTATQRHITSKECSICGVAYLNGQQQCTCNAGPLKTTRNYCPHYGWDCPDCNATTNETKPDAWLVLSADGWRYLSGGEGDARARIERPGDKLYPLFRGEERPWVK